MLKNKNILIGVTGSIAIYKSLEIIRLFIKQNANVRVLMSEEAKKFITPLTFEALSQNVVLHKDTESWANDLNHIHIGKWADLFVIAPISANSINKLSNGISDNLLTQSVLAFTKKIIIAPSANTNMIQNTITKKSIQNLKELGFIISEPQSKLLACKDIGIGAMSEPQDIFNVCARELLKDKFWAQKDVIISGGGSVEKIDDVRCLSNFSSGKMASSLAYAFYLKGANVTLITSKPETNNVATICLKKVNSSFEFKQELQSSLTKNSYLFMAAAISDFKPLHVNKGKMKKSDYSDTLTLELSKNEDILLSIDKKYIKTIGFKAETDKQNAKKYALNMLKEKNLNAVCLNILEEENNFGSDLNEVTFITKENERTLKLTSKFDISMDLVELAKSL